MTLNSVTVGDITIEGQQAQPPAGHNDIAFRPACSQLASTLTESGVVEHAVNLPDGQVRVLATYESMPIDKAHLFLDAEGICKVGADAVVVPIIYSDQVPEQSVASATASASNPSGSSAIEPPSSGGMGGMVMGAIALAVVGAGFCLFTQRRGSPIQTPNAAAKPESKAGKGVSDLTKW